MSEGPNLIEDAIAAAEVVADPLSALADRIVADPSAALAPDAVAQLAALKRDDPEAFERLRSRFRKAGVRVGVLDKAVAAEKGERRGRPPSQAQLLAELAQDAQLFHTANGDGFADVEVDGHRETWPLNDRRFGRWLRQRLFEANGCVPTSEAMKAAMQLVEARAQFRSPLRTIHTRVAEHDGRLYLDLGDPERRVVEIDAAGWRVKADPPVRFRRSGSMRALPVPEAGGSIATLRQFLNVRSDSDFILVVAWALAVLRGSGPFPVLVLSGEQGSAKSTFSAILRRLLDPTAAPLRALPRDDRDLFVAAENGHLLVFDNVSHLPTWLSDTLCRLATGGGFAVRELYTDRGEVVFDATRPVILNGIEDIVARPDLADRALLLTLEPIPADRRRPEAELWAAFEAECPRILGALLDAVAEGLRRLPHTRLLRLPRMADFARWAVACELALWPSGSFMAAYDGNRAEAIEGVLDGDPVAGAVRTLMRNRTEWTGTASDLLGTLGALADQRVTKSKVWPGSARLLSGQLRRLATFLRGVGIEVTFGREGRQRTRTIRFDLVAAPETAGIPASASSASSVSGREPNPSNGLTAPGPRTVGGPADADAGTAAASVRANPLISGAADAADDADANIRSFAVLEQDGWSTRL